MKHCLVVLAVALLMGPAAVAQDKKIRVLAFGSHPDDVEIKFAGVAAKFAAKGHLVKFVSVTNGDVGHCEQSGEALAKRRWAEAMEAGRRLGVAEYEIMDNHDGQLMPTLENRNRIIRMIRSWRADIVLAPRTNDYQADHRYTGVLVQDAGILVQLPKLLPDTPALKHNPLFLYYEDPFTQPLAFRPDIAIDIDDVWEKKLDAFEAMPSQFYEAQPMCYDGGVEVPTGHAERRKWLDRKFSRPLTANVRRCLAKWYGPDRAEKIRHAEAFEISEYGRLSRTGRLSRDGLQADAVLRELFPFFD